MSSIAESVKNNPREACLQAQENVKQDLDAEAGGRGLAEAIGGTFQEEYDSSAEKDKDFTPDQANVSEQEGDTEIPVSE
eukprot:SM000014S00406  [mRNA]  locus=s14:1194414:1194861:+ [translate_table: standard]